MVRTLTLLSEARSGVKVVPGSSGPGCSPGWGQYICTLGAFHYAEDSGNFGRNSKGKARFGFFRPEYSGSHLEVVHLFRLEYSDRNSPFYF